MEETLLGCRFVRGPALFAAVVLLGLWSADASGQEGKTTRFPRQTPEMPGTTPERNVGAQPKFDSEHYATGDWFGLRNLLYENGIDITGDYVTEPLGNPVGGLRQGFTYTHNIGVQIDFDLDKIAGWQGATFRVSASQRSGRSLTERDIGNTFSVQQIFGGQTIKLVDFQLINSLFDDRLNLSYGRIVFNEDFLRSPYYCQFVNNAYCGNPAAVFFDVPGGLSAYPTATWGFRARFSPTPDSYVMAGIYDGDPTLGGDNKHGTDFSFGNNGVLFAAEVAYLPEQGLLGLPGAYKIGGYYHTGTFDTVTTDIAGGNRLVSGLPPERLSGRSGIYFLVDQTLYRENQVDTRGLGAFITFVLAPDQEKNLLPYFYTAGLVYEGLFAARPQDKTSLGATTGWFSDNLQDAQRAAGLNTQTAETVIELNHQFQVSPFLYFRPDLQYVIRPSGVSEIHNALVLGFEAGLRF